MIVPMPERAQDQTDLVRLIARIEALSAKDPKKTAELLAKLRPYVGSDPGGPAATPGPR